MGLICMLRGHDLDEEGIITINRDTNIKGMTARKTSHFCKRCQCLVFDSWELTTLNTRKVKA